MKTLEEIHNEVTSILKASPDVVKGRRDAIKSLALGLSKELSENLSIARLTRRRSVWFSTTQGQATEGNASVNVQMLGIQVGVLSFADGKWLFTPKKRRVANFAALFPEFIHGNTWEWSGNGVSVLSLAATRNLSPSWQFFSA